MSNQQIFAHFCEVIFHMAVEKFTAILIISKFIFISSLKSE